MTNKEKLAYELIKTLFLPREIKEVCLMALEKQMQTCEDCLHAGPLQISHNTVFCFEHSCAMSSDNCCRDWIQRLGERR